MSGKYFAKSVIIRENVCVVCENECVNEKVTEFE